MGSAGKAIQAIMERKGISQHELAVAVGCSDAYISMLLNDKIEDLKLSRAIEIADAMGVTLDDVRDEMSDAQ